MPKPWMIYGANGYTGELIAREAVRRGLKPVLAGRTAAKVEPLAASLDLQARVFDLLDAVATARSVEGMGLVLHCAGPFSATAAPMMAACLATHAHYLDITGEIGVFEHARTLDAAARAAGIVICPGVGFDVIPTDCVAAALKAALPDATHLVLGFDSRSGFSPGTAKTSVEARCVGTAYHIRAARVTSPGASTSAMARSSALACQPRADVVTHPAQVSVWPKTEVRFNSSSHGSLSVKRCGAIWGNLRRARWLQRRGPARP